MFGMPIWALYLLAGVALYGSGAASGWRVEAWHRDSVDEKRIEAAVAERQKIEERLAKVSADYEQAKAARNVETRTITKTVDRIVEKPVYRAVCLDDDGLRAANAAISGAADPGQSPGGLSAGRPAR